MEQILSKAAIPHQGIQINALEGELPQGYERDQIFQNLGAFGRQDRTDYRNCPYHSALV